MPVSSTWSVLTSEAGQTIDTRIGVEAAVEAHQLSDARAGHDPNMQCTPGRQALVAPVPASDPLQLLPLVGVEEDLQALTHSMSSPSITAGNTRLHAIWPGCERRCLC